MADNDKIERVMQSIRGIYAKPRGCHGGSMPNQGDAMKIKEIPQKSKGYWFN